MDCGGSDGRHRETAWPDVVAVPIVVPIENLVVVRLAFCVTVVGGDRYRVRGRCRAVRVERDNSGTCRDSLGIRYCIVAIDDVRSVSIRCRIVVMRCSGGRDNGVARVGGRSTLPSITVVGDASLGGWAAAGIGDLEVIRRIDLVNGDRRMRTHGAG